MAEDGGHFITLFVSYLCKYLVIRHLVARGVEPLSLTLYLADAEASEPLNVVKMAKKWLRGFYDILESAA